MFLVKNERLVTSADGMSLSYNNTDRFEIRGKLFWFAFCKDEFSKVCHISKAQLREEIYSSKFL